MSGILRWEEPPQQIGGRTPGFRPTPRDPYESAAAELRANPGVWGVVYEGENGIANGLAGRIKRGLSVAFQPAGVFDAVSRKRDGVTVTYARYIGGAL